MKFYSKRFVKILGVCLAVAVFMASLPIISAMAEISVPEAGKDYFVGETVLDTNFDENEVDTLPEDFVTAIGWVHPSSPAKYYSSIVDAGEGDKVIYFGSDNSDYYVFTNKLPVMNYIYETEVTVVDNFNSLGICVNNYGNDQDNVVVGGKGLVVFCKSQTIEVAGYTLPFPEGEDALENGETVKFKVLSFEGTDHYYMNDKLVASINQAHSNAAYGYERVGFYTYGGKYNIDSIKVTAIHTPLEYEPATGLKEGIDFVRGEELVADWKTNYTAIGPRGWWPGTPSVTSNNDGSISFSCNKDAILGFGKITAADYVMEATVTHTGNAGIAFINNINGAKPLESYDLTVGDTNIGSAMLSLVYPTNWTSITDDKSIAYKDKVNNNEYYPESLPAGYERPSVGDTYTIKLICLGGKNYFYYNDLLVLTCDITQYRGANTYVGLYL